MNNNQLSKTIDLVKDIDAPLFDVEDAITKILGSYDTVGTPAQKAYIPLYTKIVASAMRVYTNLMNWGAQFSCGYASMLPHITPTTLRINDALKGVFVEPLPLAELADCGMHFVLDEYTIDETSQKFVENFVTEIVYLPKQEQFVVEYSYGVLVPGKAYDEQHTKKITFPKWLFTNGVLTSSLLALEEVTPDMSNAIRYDYNQLQAQIEELENRKKKLLIQLDGATPAKIIDNVCVGLETLVKTTQENGND